MYKDLLRCIFSEVQMRQCLYKEKLTNNKNKDKMSSSNMYIMQFIKVGLQLQYNTTAHNCNVIMNTVLLIA